MFVLYVVATTSQKTNSNTSNKSLNRISSGDHKRTWQRVSNILLPYLYKVLIVSANNKLPYTKVYV